MVQHHEFCIAEHTVTALLAALNESVTEKFASQLTEFGYDSERLIEGTELANSIHEELRHIQAEFGQLVSETTHAHQKYRCAKATYETTRRIAETAFQDLPEAQRTYLLGTASESWIEEAITFHERISEHPIYLDRMKSVGYSPVRLREETAQIKQYIEEPIQYPQLSLPEALENSIEILMGWAEEYVSAVKSAELNEPVFRTLIKEFSM